MGGFGIHLEPQNCCILAKLWEIRGQHATATARDNTVVLLGKVEYHLAFQRAEVTFALLGKNLGNGCACLRFDEFVDIQQGYIQFVGKVFCNGAFVAGSKTDDNKFHSGFDRNRIRFVCGLEIVHYELQRCVVVYKKLHGIEVSLDTPANKVCNAHVRKHVSMAESFARVDVGHVHFDNGDTNALDAIAKGVAVVRVGAGIEHNGIAVRLLKDVDKFAFDVALGTNYLRTKGFGKLLHLLLQCGKGVATVQRWIAFAEHVHIYAVEK